eukprot:gene13347-13475_t
MAAEEAQPTLSGWSVWLLRGDGSFLCEAALQSIDAFNSIYGGVLASSQLASGTKTASHILADPSNAELLRFVMSSMMAGSVTIIANSSTDAGKHNYVVQSFWPTAQGHF